MVQKEQRIQNEDWYKQLASALYNYKSNKARKAILEERLLQSVLPTERVTAKYGETSAGGGHDYDKDEAELERLRHKVKSIDIAMETLTTSERAIIEYKFFERRKDIIIYEMLIPMAPATFYKKLDDAMEKLYFVVK